MTTVDRAALRSGLHGWVAGSEELGRLGEALHQLFPGRRRPSLSALAEGVLLSAVRLHEGATRDSLGRLSEALARLMDDVEALSHGRVVPGRAAVMRGEDLRTVERALEDLSKLEDRVRHALATDEAGSWADQLRIELETSLRGGPAGGPAAGLWRARARPMAAGQAFDQLRTVFERLGVSRDGLWHARALPPALADAAHDYFIAAGGDVAAAVRRAIAEGGPHADAMVIAILWREGHIAPGRPTGTEAASAMHQRRISGLDFEWMGQFQPGTWNGRFDPGSIAGTLGIDHIAGGLLVDAKHTGVPLEALPHLTQTPEPRTSWAEAADVAAGADVAIAESQRARSLAAEERAWDEARHDYLDQMRRQLEFARTRGLRGVQWVCNTGELAEAFRLLSMEVPAGERAGLVLDFRVGGLP